MAELTKEEIEFIIREEYAEYSLKDSEIILMCMSYIDGYKAGVLRGAEEMGGIGNTIAEMIKEVNDGNT